MTDEQHNAWIRVAVLVALITAAAACAITGHEDAAYTFGVAIFFIFIGVL
jgi:hypothetical protein